MAAEPRWIPFRGLKLAAYEYAPGGPPRGDLVWLHANGYTARTYEPLYAQLNAAGWRVCALDFAGHGRSDSTRDFRDWLFFRDQVLALLDELRLERATLIGHSMGAAAASLAAGFEARNKVDRIAALALLDPTVFTPLFSRLLPLLPHPLARQAKRRRARFASLAAPRRAYRMSPAFRNWRADVFECFLESAFRPTENDDGIELCLAPEIEAQNFRSFHAGQWREHKRHRVPTLVLQANPSPVCPDRGRKLLTRGNSKSRGLQHPGGERGSHFFPMEDPDWTCARILEFLERLTD